MKKTKLLATIITLNLVSSLAVTEMYHVSKAQISTAVSTPTQINVETQRIESASVESGFLEKTINETSNVEIASPKKETSHTCNVLRNNNNDGVLKLLVEKSSQLKSEVKKKHKDYYLNSVSDPVKATSYILSTQNFKQEYMNNVYYALRSKRIDGSCTEVAATSIAEYYTKKKHAITYTGKVGCDNCFCEFVDIALKGGYFDPNPKSVNFGTKHASIPGMFKSFYKKHDISLGGCLISDDEEMYKKIKDYNHLSKPVMGNFNDSSSDSGHSMPVIGSYELTVKLKKNKNSKQETKKYVYLAVNDGQRNCVEGDGRVQYIQKKYLTNIIYLK